MKRLMVSLAGFGCGMVFTWACFLLLDRFGWFRDPHKIAHGCHELGKCAFSWYNWPILYVLVLGPATLATVINAYAWQRWPIKRWAYCTGAAMILWALLYPISTIILER